MSRTLKIHGATLLWAVLIFILSSIPYLRPPDLLFTIKDVFVHAVEYGIFGYFLQRSGRELFGNRYWVCLLAIIVGIVYGALDEYHQSFVDGRMATWADFIADSIGILLGSVLFFIFRK